MKAIDLLSYKQYYAYVYNIQIYLVLCLPIWRAQNEWNKSRKNAVNTTTTTATVTKTLQLNEENEKKKFLKQKLDLFWLYDEEIKEKKTNIQVFSRLRSIQISMSGWNWCAFGEMFIKKYKIKVNKDGIESVHEFQFHLTKPKWIWKW